MRGQPAGGAQQVHGLCPPLSLGKLSGFRESPLPAPRGCWHSPYVTLFSSPPARVAGGQEPVGSRQVLLLGI